MSWHFSLVQVEEFSQVKPGVTELCALLRKTRIASKSSFGDKKIRSSRRSRSGTTSKPLMEQTGEGLLISYLLGSLANHSVKQENSEVEKTIEICGQKQSGSYGRYDPKSSSWKTPPDCYGCTEELSSATFPKWGTTLNGELFPLEKPELPTLENAGGAWPTPTVSHAVRGNHDEPLDNYEQRVTDYEEGRAKGKPGRSLGVAVRQSYPTPRASEYKGTGPLGSKSHKHRLDRKYLDATIQEKEQATGKLNPDWVEWLMGWPIGWTSLNPINELSQSTVIATDKLWEIDPGDSGHIPRLKDDNSYRINRLKALGNGQVPLQASLAYLMLNLAPPPSP